MLTMTIFNGDLGLSIFPHPTDDTVMIVAVIDLWSSRDYEPFIIPKVLLEKLLGVNNAKS